MSLDPKNSADEQKRALEAPQSFSKSLAQPFGAGSFGANSTESGLATFHSVRRQVDYAGFWIRFCAYCLDALILSVIALPISLLGIYLQVITLGLVDGEGASQMLATQMMVNLASYALTTTMTICYYGYFYSRLGASPGKMVFGIRVLDSRDGTHLKFWRAALREIIGKGIINFLTLFIGFFMAGLHEKKRGLHDTIFDTQVIRIRR